MIRHNTEIYDLYKEVKVSVFIKLRRLQWAGYVIRMNDKRIPKNALQQTIHGKRAAGKPRKRWEDAVQEDSIKLLGTKAWKRKAKDRQFWRQRIEEANAQYGLYVPWRRRRRKNDDDDDDDYDYDDECPDCS
jgi:hypothetical protein